MSFAMKKQIKNKNKNLTMNDRARQAILEMATSLHNMGKMNSEELKKYQLNYKENKND